MSVLELRQVSTVYGQGSAEVHALREVSIVDQPMPAPGPGSLLAQDR